MTPEEYNAYHKEALIMKKAADKIFGKRNTKQKTKWHDLRKNINDLPEAWEKVYIKLSTGQYTYAMYGDCADTKFHWWYRDAIETRRNEIHAIIPYSVIAWCIPPELPVFDEDE